MRSRLAGGTTCCYACLCCYCSLDRYLAQRFFTLARWLTQQATGKVVEPGHDGSKWQRDGCPSWTSRRGEGEEPARLELRNDLLSRGCRGRRA